MNASIRLAEEKDKARQSIRMNITSRNIAENLHSMLNSQSIGQFAGNVVEMLQLMYMEKTELEVIMKGEKNGSAS